MSNYEFKNIICQRIKDLRESNQLNIEQLAYRSGISKGGLSEIDKFKKIPTILTVLKLCNGLGISINEFFNFREIHQYADKI